MYIKIIFYRYISENIDICDIYKSFIKMKFYKDEKKSNVHKKD